jgi:hypothetical protein
MKSLSIAKVSFIMSCLGFYVKIAYTTIKENLPRFLMSFFLAFLLPIFLAILIGSILAGNPPSSAYLFRGQDFLTFYFVDPSKLPEYAERNPNSIVKLGLGNDVLVVILIVSIVSAVYSALSKGSRASLGSIFTVQAATAYSCCSFTVLPLFPLLGAEASSILLQDILRYLGEFMAIAFSIYYTISAIRLIRNRFPCRILISSAF